jgi:hypothetical protein
MPVLPESVQRFQISSGDLPNVDGDLFFTDTYNIPRK